MSRHRRLMQLDDYLEEYDDYENYDEYDVHEEEEHVGQQDLYDQHSQDQSQHHRDAAFEAEPPPPRHTPLDDEILSELVHQFRQALSDDSLNKTTVDAALAAANYDWELALSHLRTRRPTAAREASPSPIGQLLDGTASAAAVEWSPPRMPSEVEPPVVATATAAPHLEYETFVADAGYALFVPRDFAPQRAFRFDKPSPDDVVRAHQTRTGGARKTVALRLPKAAQPRAPSLPLTEDGVSGADSAAWVAPPRKPHTTGARKPQSQRDRPVDPSARLAAGVPSLAVLVAGHVDAGKSSLLGHILTQLQGMRRRPQNLAWLMDEDPVERDRGVTIDIATRLIDRPTVPPRALALIDSPGHRDFVPAMILGAVQAGAALLVVDTSPGEFEAGFEEDGQTREHAYVIKSLGVASLVIVLNKMDVVEFNEARFNEVRSMLVTFLKSAGWKNADSLPFVPVSALEGINLVSSPPKKHPLRHWYSGRTLMGVLDKLPSASKEAVEEVRKQPTRLVVSDFFKSTSLGGQAAVTGRLLCGTVAPKDRLQIVPGDVHIQVKSVAIGEGQRVSVAIAGFDAVPVSIGIVELPPGYEVRCGAVLCNPKAATTAAVVFRARVNIIGMNVIVLCGSPGIIHVGGGHEAGSVSKLCELVGGKKGAQTKKWPPRRLVHGDSAVVEFELERPVAMERQENLKGLARFAFRQEGRTVAVGLVVDIIKTAQDVEREKAQEEARKAHLDSGMADQ